MWLALAPSPDSPIRWRRDPFLIGVTRFRAGLVNQGLRSDANGEILRRLRLLDSNVRVNGNSATIGVVMNVPEPLIDTIHFDDVQTNIRRRAKFEYRLDVVVIKLRRFPPWFCVSPRSKECRYQFGVVNDLVRFVDAGSLKSLKVECVCVVAAAPAKQGVR